MVYYLFFSRRFWVKAFTKKKAEKKGATAIVEVVLVKWFRKPYVAETLQKDGCEYAISRGVVVFFVSPV